jgi:DNA-binding HxlR family transcriptional regulator
MERLREGDRLTAARSDHDARERMALMPRPSPTLAQALDSPCGIIRSLGVLADSWSFMIVREALLGARTFVQFRDRLGITSDVLSARLATLVGHGVMEKIPYREPGQRTRDAYHLTPEGEELKVVMVAMQQWGEAHVPRTPGSRVLPVTVETSERVRAGLLDPRGRALASVDVAFVRTSAAEISSS